jgi:pyridoxal phosphate enzyme (YggS family)
MIADNVDRIRGRIVEACRRSGRTPSEVTLIAVGKTFPAGDLAQAARAGVTDIGENYVQELVGKRGELTDPRLRWHFIGHLQSNKVKYIAEWITMIHAVDSLSLAREIDRQAARADRIIDLLVEVNTTGEKSKFGVRPDEAAGLIRTMADLGHIRVGGLMTIGPFLPDPEGSRPMFRELRQVREELSKLGQPNATMQHLSMGMTGDFEVAIEEGATCVRIGTAIFGSRVRRA